MLHYRKTSKKYSKLNKNDKSLSGCTFCKEIGGPRIVKENNTMFVIANRVSYDMFEGRRVTDHYMVIPKRHVESLKDFTEQEKLDHMTLLGEYEDKGYNVYARALTSISRTAKHQHTHMIKLLNKHSRMVFYTKNPHILIDF
jgi:diadenosine tetraphosphate (Ap4A) HIT family hydrolase